MKIYAGQLIPEIIHQWVNVVLMQSHSGKRSIFAWMSATYIWWTNETSKFLIAKKATFEATRQAIHVPTIPSNFIWHALETNMNGRIASKISEDSIYMSVLKTNKARESYRLKEYRDTEIHSLYIELTIINEDFSFTPIEHFNRLVNENDILNILRNKQIISAETISAKQLTSERWDVFWTWFSKVTPAYIKGVAHIINEQTSWLEGEVLQDKYYLVWTFKEPNFVNNEISWTDKIMPADIIPRMPWITVWIDNLKINETYKKEWWDSIIMEIWQLINISLTRTNQSIKIWWATRNIRTPISYINERRETTHVITPDIQPTQTLREENYSTFTYTPNTRLGADYEFITELMSQQQEQIRQESQPQQQIHHELEIGQIVYIKPGTIQASKMTRRNKEYYVHSLSTIDSKGREFYNILPATKKNFNQEQYIQIDSKLLVKAEKVTKRKFVLQKDFWKYKAGTVFTREELVSVMWKFQDARDPFILNKLYTCAE